MFPEGLDLNFASEKLVGLYILNLKKSYVHVFFTKGAHYSHVAWSIEHV